MNWTNIKARNGFQNYWSVKLNVVSVVRFFKVCTGDKIHVTHMHIYWDLVYAI